MVLLLGLLVSAYNNLFVQKPVCSRDERKVPSARREGPNRGFETWICTTVAPDSGEVQYKSGGGEEEDLSFSEGW